MRSKNVWVFVLVFVFGVIAGLGIGTAYGKSQANADLQQSNLDLTNQFKTVNENYMLLVREYNKLFSIKSEMMVAVPVSDSVSAPVQVPVETTATAEPAAATAVPAASQPAATQSADTGTSSTGAPVAEFEAASIGGTGPLEGPPPQPFKFTDLSTGDITSWEWDFGDGETSTEQNPEHTFRACPGEKEMCTVTLKVCGPGGCDTMTKVDYLWVSESCTGC